MFRKGTACVLAALMVLGTVSVCSAAETYTENNREVSRFKVSGTVYKGTSVVDSFSNIVSSGVLGKK